MQHVIDGVAYLLIGYAIIIVAGAVVVPFYALWAAWFGAIYLVPALLSVFVLGLIATRRGHVVSRKNSLIWFVGEGATGVGLAALYSAAIVPLYSGTQVSQLVGIQLSHSGACFIAAVLVAVVWQMINALRRRSKN